MHTGTDRIVENVGKLVAELETVITRAQDTGERMGDRLEEGAAGLRSSLDMAHRRVGKLQAELARRLHRTARAADETVRENPWQFMAIAASAALLLGLALASGSRKSKRASTDGANERPVS
jgi:ElaB/YqjD/DUF883 family membrane-anchored ribosome-binding protein